MHFAPDKHRLPAVLRPGQEQECDWRAAAGVPGAKGARGRLSAASIVGAIRPGGTVNLAAVAGLVQRRRGRVETVAGRDQIEDGWGVAYCVQ